MAVRVLSAIFFCILATLVWAQPPPSPGNSKPAPLATALGRNVTCKDIDGKYPPCTGPCPESCPQQCVVRCPGCRTSCLKQVRPPAMFVFGDGQVDIDNSNQVASGNFSLPPHDEQQTLDSQWIGNDGYNTAEYIGKLIGFHGSPPAYTTLRRPIRVDQAFTGVNYACGGAGLRDPLPEIDGWLTIPMSMQLQQFAATKAQMVTKLGAKAASDLLAQSFFLIEVGEVDLTHILNYPYTKTEVHELLIMYEGTIRSLYNMGARRFGLINVGLIGSTPSIRGGGFNGADMNNHAAQFNDGLKTLLAGLANSLPGLRYSIADLYTLTKTVFANPSAYGFKDIQDSCCPDAGYGPPPYTDECDKPAEFWYWSDWSYLTDHAADLAATTFFNGPPQFTMPVTFKALLDGK